ncbi:hypothetical protein [Echinicola rosea]|uniref:Uncharacterized protein n=1 Tax=Echinicola rosea TaxID=1807691 RepID=A0ABQ1V1H1_9BACT|nr:hypothetical protein [Echinicola rosea]GGF34456.1 hypothetical protein GCM10011339_23400 [Echinicola rosea]
MKDIESQKTLIRELNNLRKSLVTLEEIPDTDIMFKNLVYACMAVVENLHAYRVNQANQFGKELAVMARKSINISNKINHLDGEEAEHAKVLLDELTKILNKAQIRNNLLGL